MCPSCGMMDGRLIVHIYTIHRPERTARMPATDTHTRMHERYRAFCLARSYVSDPTACTSACSTLRVHTRVLLCTDPNEPFTASLHRTTYYPYRRHRLVCTGEVRERRRVADQRGCARRERCATYRKPRGRRRQRWPEFDRPGCLKFPRNFMSFHCQTEGTRPR